MRCADGVDPLAGASTRCEPRHDRNGSRFIVQRDILRASRVDDRTSPPTYWGPNFPQAPMHADEHHRTPPRPQPADVGRAVAAVTASGSTAEIERIVRAYVRALKAANVPPEQALKRVKDVVGVPSIAASPPQPHRLGDDLVAWFVADPRSGSWELWRRYNSRIAQRVAAPPRKAIS